VSSTAGEAWTDSPVCTHPLLAHLARLVNDSVSDPARQRLLPLVASLATADSDDPGTYARLALMCTTAALRERSSLLLVHLRRAASADLGRDRAGRWGEIRHRGYVHGPAYRGVEVAVGALMHLPPDRRDAALRHLLVTGIATVKGQPGAAGSAIPGRSAQPRPRGERSSAVAPSRRR